MAATTTSSPDCMLFRLPPDGVIIFNETQTITLDQAAVFEPACTSQPSLPADFSLLPIIDRDQFYESTIPQVFVLGAMLIISWSLVIILIITPRTQLIVGGHGGSSLGRGGVVGGTANSATVIGVGGRPWLQKVAAVTVAISLLIATNTTFKVVMDQYSMGYDDASEVTNEVSRSLEMKIVRIISDTFLWLAQAQTVIRLFPRHKEKVIIKWAGFGLIILDTLFSILNSFVPSVDGEKPYTRNKKFAEPIPALAYLFDTLLSLIYAACVLYYSWVKGRFAYFHPKMRNICVVALLSVLSILIPVVFFVMDIALPTLISWSDFVRWVGAAAASVVVWEWVERIEALEREERKEGILGREVFEGDDMAIITPSIGIHWPQSRSNYKPPGGGSRGVPVSSYLGSDSVFSRTGNPPHYSRHAAGEGSSTAVPSSGTVARSWHFATNSTSPTPATSPVSRSNTNSAASTIYAMIRHSVSPSTSPAHGNPLQPVAPGAIVSRSNLNSPLSTNNTPSPYNPANTSLADTSHPTASIPPYLSRVPFLPNPFKRRYHDPPSQVSQSAVDLEGKPSSARASRGFSARDLLLPRRHQPIPVDKLPIVVVPAQPRDKVWSPSVSNSAQSANTASDNSPETSSSFASPSNVLGARASPGSESAERRSGRSPSSPSMAAPSPSPTMTESAPSTEQRLTPPHASLDTRPSPLMFHSRSSEQRAGCALSTLPVVQEHAGSDGSGEGSEGEERKEN